MNETNNFALVRKPSSAVEKVAPRAKRILAGMVGDTLILAKSAQSFGILWIDDDSDWLKYVETFILRDFRNVTVKTFQNRDEAWKELLRRDPGILIADLSDDNTPGRERRFGMSGLQLLLLLAERKVSYPIFIGSTSLSKEGNEKAAMQSDGKSLNVSFLTPSYPSQFRCHSLFRIREQLQTSRAVPTERGLVSDWTTATEVIYEVKSNREKAERGSAFDQLLLGISCEKGVGVVQNFVEAYKWLKLAAAQNHKKAVEKLNLLLPNLTPGQIQEGERRFREFIPEK